MARGRTSWGSVRRLPSGRYQARYRIDAVTHVAPSTFRTKRDADVFLARVRTDIERGVWVDPEAGKITVREYAIRWLRERPNLRPRTVELYEGELRLHILPVLGDLELSQLSSGRVRTWHADMLTGDRPGKSTVAKCYRLISSIMATALEDGLIGRNPCVLKNAGVERPRERPIATVDEVFALAEAIEPRYRTLVLTATFTGLRLGELRALKRKRFDLLHMTVQVVEQLQELSDGTLVTGPPKSDAGSRVVSIPPAMLPELEAHLGAWCLPGEDELVFPGAQGRPFRRASLYTAWRRATRAIGLEDLHFHDLRHTGNTLAAATGASTKELMSRMGHASPRAALIYQHASRERDHAIAAALSDVFSAAKPASSATVVRLPGAADR